MTEYLSTLRGLTLRESGYILILALEDQTWTELRRALHSHATKFGNLVGIGARIIRATDHGHTTIIDDLLAKTWPEATRRLIHETDRPFLVIIGADFDDFDPAQHDWRVIFFAGARSPRKSIPRLFERFLDQVRLPGDLFAFLDRTYVYGTVVGPETTDPAVTRRSPGRPSIFDPEHGVEDWIREQLQEGRINPQDTNWRNQLVTSLLAAKPSLRTYNTKSVRDALRLKGFFAAIGTIEQTPEHRRE
ncbi:MAG: hypothetical protein O3A96_12160 [Proteobacteria bacterium]|nr:hypothetical protein [Pseudomonadota bacterium]